MQIFFGRLVTWLAASVLTIWTGYKTFFLVSFIGFLSVALYSLFLYGVEDVLDTVLTKFSTLSDVPSGTSNLTQFSGLAGWFIGCCKIPECISVIVDIVIIKWTLRKIPLIKW